VRAAIIPPLFQEDPDLVPVVSTREARWTRPTATCGDSGGVFPAFYRFRYKIKAQRLEQDRADVANAPDGISREPRAGVDCSGKVSGSAHFFASPTVHDGCNLYLSLAADGRA
jgi:hypothetical protein